MKSPLNFLKQSDTPRMDVVESKRIDFFQRNPVAAALSTKLIKDTTSSYIDPTTDGGTNEMIFEQMVIDRARRNLDNESLVELLPDLLIVKEVTISTIMSPISMDQEGFSFNTKDTDLPNQLTRKINEPIEKHFTTYIDINEETPERIDNAMYLRGADVKIIVPESAIDQLINRPSMESATLRQNFLGYFDEVTGLPKPVGLLGSCNRGDSVASLESFFDTTPSLTETKLNDMWFITDNLDVLKLPSIKSKLNKQRMRAKVNPIHHNWGNRNTGNTTVSNEAVRVEKITSENLHDRHVVQQVGEAIYHNPGSMPSRSIDQIPSYNQTNRPTIGRPAVFSVNSSALIPAFQSGNPKKHVAYILLLDDYGVPLDMEAELRRAVNQGYVGLKGNGQMDMTSQLVQQTRIMKSGYNWDNHDSMTNQEKHRLYTAIFEENLKRRITNGILGHDIDLGDVEDTYNVMLLRLWGNQRTKMVFIPAEQVSYLAYDYDPNGMGKSFMDGVRQIAAIRAMTTFANFYSAVSNAVGRTKVGIEIDPRDPDPEKAYTVAMDQYMRGMAGVVPTDVSSSADMFRVMRQMGIMFEPKGNSRLPQTTVEVEEFRGQKQMIDTDFMDELKTLNYAGLYVTPEMIDATQDTEFAISRWTSNQLYSKRCRGWQKITCKATDKFIESYTRSDGTLLNEIRDIIDELKESLPEDYLDENNSPLYDAILDEYFRVFYTDLPAPNNVKFEQSQEAFETYMSTIDTAIEYVLMEEVTGESVADENSNYIQNLKATVKAYLARQWMDKNHFLPELMELVGPVTEDSPAIDIAKETIIAVTNFANQMGDFGAAVKLRREKHLEWLSEHNTEYGDAIQGQTGGGEPASTDSDDSGEGDGNSSPDDDPFASMPTFDLPDDNAEGGDSEGKSDNESGDGDSEGSSNEGGSGEE